MPVYYLCPEHKHPVGGVRVIYRHVDILNENGIPAYVVHKTKGFRVSWFENDTPVVYWKDTPASRLQAKVKRRIGSGVVEMRISGNDAKTIGGDDILVIPEMYGPDVADAYGRGIKKVILNQNVYLTFKGYSWQKERLITPYNHPDVIATLVNSVDGEEYLRHVFPDLPLYPFRLSIDPELFYYCGEKKKQICFSRIKNQPDALQVLSIVKFRGALKDFDVVPFINVPQSEVARICRESMIFLSFGYPEGFGLPAAEAMACGCVVVGFHGGGGKEFFKPEFSYPIEQGDIIGFARTVEEVIEAARANETSIFEKGRAAAAFIRNAYSPEREEKEVLDAWHAILQR
jgi:hypothetical protein